MASTLLERLTFEPAAPELEQIPFPAALAPKPADYHAGPTAKLPTADVLLVTWTSAEWMALADVFTPGVHKSKWLTYAENWDYYEAHLTGRSPAHYAKCMAQYYLTRVGTTRVLCVHSELHLATDDDTAPVVALWKQMLTEVGPSLVITTGTAGGIGMSTVLGDVFVVGNAKFNCTKMFKSQSWAQERFEGSTPTAGSNAELANEKLIGINAAKLPKEYTPRTPKIIFGGDVETVDYFGFDDTDDSYGIVKNDPTAHTEEMDDATLPLALQQLYYATEFAAPRWASIRNASDPEVPSSIGTLEQQSKWASQIYEKWGYTTTIGSAIACWAVIADQVGL